MEDPWLELKAEIGELRNMLACRDVRIQDLLTRLTDAHEALRNSQCRLEYDITKERHMLGLVFTDQEMRQNKHFVENQLRIVEGKLTAYYKKIMEQ